MAEIDSTTESSADPYVELVRLDAQYHADELAEVGRTPAATNGDNSDGLGDETPSDPSSQKRVGRDQVLKFLQENEASLPGGAEIFKNQQRQISSLGEKSSTQETRLAALEEQFKGGDDEPEVDPAVIERRERIARFRPDQKQMIEDLLEEEGFVRRSELDEERAEVDAKNYTDRSVSTGIEDLGEDFGQMVDGKFVWNEDIADDVKEHYARLTSDETGIVPTDLYWIVQGPKLAEELKSLKAGNVRTGDRETLRRRMGSQTVRTSAPSNGSRRSVEKTGDLDKTVEAAVLESLNELQGN